MQSNADLILSLDLGTSAIKAGLFSTSGELVSQASREQPLLFPETDHVEQSPTTTWRLMVEATREVLATVSAGDVVAIVTTTHRGSVVPIRGNGEAMTDLIVWMDRRALRQVDRLNEVVGSAEYYDISGHPIVAATGVSKLLWLRDEARAIWDEAEVIGPPQTLFNRWLGSEESVVDYSSGSYLFPCDIRTMEWSGEIARALSFSTDKLPSLVPATTIVGHLKNPAATDLGLPTGIPIIAGGGDGQCAAAGSGVVAPGTVMVNIGTATGVQVFLSEPFFDAARTLNCAAHVVPNSWEMEGHTQASGTVLRWFRDEFGGVERLMGSRSNHDAYDLLIDQASRAPAGSGGLLFLPTFNGSSAPVIDPNATGAIVGLKLSHTRSHVIRSVLEGISLEVRWMLDTMARAGVPVEEVRLAGGGSRNETWNQIHADILNRPLRTVRHADAALVGAAMCAAVAIGVFPHFQAANDAFVKFGPTITPQEKNVAVYESCLTRYISLVGKLSGN